MQADESTSANGRRGHDPCAALIDRRGRVQRELDESIAIMNADAYLMTSRLSGMAASKDRALHQMTAALTVLKVAEHGGDDAEIERRQWRVIDAARTLCQVIGRNVVELGKLMTAGLANYNTAVTNVATVIDIHTGLAGTPRTPDPSDDTAE